MQESNHQKEKSYLGFTRHDLALGVAGFVAAVDVVMYPLTMWHTRSPHEEGMEITKEVYRILMTPLKVREKHNKV